MPDEAEIGKYYAADEYQPLAPRASGLELVSRVARFLRQPTKVRLLEKALGRRGRLLDIGSGTGEFAACAEKRGWKAVCIEPSIRGKEHAERRFRLDVRSPDALMSLPAESFDAVTLWHSLEHLHDVRGTLAHVRRLLTADGAAAIAVPNHECVDAEIYGNAWFAHDLPRHLSHFTAATLERWIADAGMHLERLQGMILDGAYICYRTEKHRGRNVLCAFPTAMRSIAEGLWNPRRSSTILALIRKSPTS